MRKVTNNVINAFENGRAFKSGNDNVTVEGTTVKMYLHGNLIAKREKGRTFITNCGYQTNVTKERLNGLRGVSIHQSKGVWYLNDKAWDGEWIEIR